jgi:serine/threonine protein kinase
MTQSDQNASEDGTSRTETPLSEMRAQPGAQIGPYRLLQEIGHGGMGMVYMADQREPVKRRVALKLIKPGMDSRQVQSKGRLSRRTGNHTRNEVTINKRRAIRSTLARLGMHSTPTQVVAALESYGIEVSENFVARVKAQMFGSETKAARERSKRPPKTKSRNRPQQRKIPSAR